MDEQAIGYDWKNDKRKPPAFEIIKLRFTRTAADEVTGGPVMVFSDERLGMWNGSEYYIFDVQAGRWIPVRKYLTLKLAYAKERHIKREDIGIQYATIPATSGKYIPYYAIAFSRRKEVTDNGKETTK